MAPVNMADGDAEENSLGRGPDFVMQLMHWISFLIRPLYGQSHPQLRTLASCAQMLSRVNTL